MDGDPSPMTRRRLFILAAACFLALLPFLSRVARGNEPHARKRLIVKVRASLAKDIEASLPLSTMALNPGQSGNATAEAFLGRHRVHKFSALYPGIVRLKKTQNLSDIQVASAVRQRFAKRANRLRATFAPPEISRTYVLEV